VKSGVGELQQSHKKEPRARKTREEFKTVTHLLTSHTNAYTYDHALPHLTAACADDDPIGQ